jgi:dipeptidyl aminopeptidase/acylaminoacyl peptidase
VKAYYLRIAIVSLALALATAALVAMAPRLPAIRVVAQGPTGDAVSAGSSIQLTFERPMDRRSVERAFALDPPTPGSFSWRGQQLSFRPDAPLQPGSSYTVTLSPGLRDERGRESDAPISWSFRTRQPLLVYLDGPLGAGRAIRVAEGGEARVLVEAAGIGALGVSPDGAQLVYGVQRAPGRTALYLVDLAGGEPRALVDDAQASVSNPTWSPDGGLIAYERRGLLPDSGVLGPPRLWIAQPDGTALGPIDGGEAVNFAPAWSPRGQRIAFVDGDAEAQAVYDFASRRSEFPNSAGEAASWSPDGESFVYTAFDDPATRRPLLRRAELAAGQAAILPGTEGAGSPAYSPDGRWIAFGRSEGSARAIWLMPADGGAPPVQLSAPQGGQDLLPIWSPDSASIVFTRLTPEAGGVASAVWRVTVAGQQTLVAEEASAPLFVP